MSTAALEQRRTWGDVVLGILLVLGGLLVLGNVVVATTLSVYFFGWMALVTGIVLFVAALFRIRSGGFWSFALGGALLAVLGLFLLRNPLIGAVSLTLLAGALFLAGGLTRLIVGFQVAEGRWILVLSGLISIGLGLYVFFNIGAASLALLGVLLGVQTLVEGFALLIMGRLHPVRAGV